MLYRKPFSLFFLYKIFGKEQLTLAQMSRLGLMLGNLTISSIGQADDTALISNDIHKLFYLLELTKIFCSKYHVELCAEKTKLQVFSTKKMAHSVALAKATSAIEIGGERIPGAGRKGYSVSHNGQLLPAPPNMFACPRV